MQKVLLKGIVTLLSILITSGLAYADDRAKLLGVWRFVSTEIEFQETGERKPAADVLLAPAERNSVAESPSGYLIFTDEGRMMVILVRGDRDVPLRNTEAYTGVYRLEGDKWITQVDVASKPNLDGEQIRFFTLNGKRLEARTAWNARKDFCEGTFKLNLAKSMFSPGPPPKSRTISYRKEGDRCRQIVDGEDAHGIKSHREFGGATFLGMEWGKEYPVLTSDPSSVTRTLTRINANTIRISVKLDGKEIGNELSVNSEDGNTQTTTQEGTNAQGQQYKNVLIYERQ